MSSIVIDSSLSTEDALRQNPASVCPDDILQKQRVIEVVYWTFDNTMHQGQVVIHEELVQDVKEIFELLVNVHFPLTSVIPIADPRFNWDDEKSMKANNTSGFNYRTIANTTKISNHAFGRALDINPFLNPFIKEDLIRPVGAQYNPSVPGTISFDSEIVKIFKSKGWEWGGDWTDRKDYQHFQKTE